MDQELNIEFNEAFNKALKLLNNSKQNVFITGKAGTGKSTFLSWFSKHTEKFPVILAPTGVAALNVNGQTIHNFFSFGIDISVEKILKKTFKPRKKDFFRYLEMIIIDEISMVRADLIDCIDAFLREYGPNKTEPFGGVQMVFIGDLYQLPPIIQREEKKAFDSVYQSAHFYSAYALQRTHFITVELENVYRQKDDKFIDILNRVRNNTVLQSDIDCLNEQFVEKKDYQDMENQEFAIYLTTTNKLADEINQYYLDKIKEKELSNEAKINGSFGFEYYPTTENLSFKVKSQVMLLNNDSAGRWVNGSIGIIEDCKTDKQGDKYLIIRLNKDAGNKTVFVYEYQWDVFQFVANQSEKNLNDISSQSVGTFKQFPIRLAWAVTIHKSQGKTFDKVIIDLGSGSFASGQVYVALSRCRSLEGIKLRTKLQKNHIRTDTSIHDFMTQSLYRQIEIEFPIEERIKLIEKYIKKAKPFSMTYLKKDNTRVQCDVTPVKYEKKCIEDSELFLVYGFFNNPNYLRAFAIERILKINDTTSSSSHT